MKKIVLMTGLLLLAGGVQPTLAEAQKEAAPQTEASGAARKTESDATSHSRDLKNNQFHERGRDRHNRAEELSRQDGANRNNSRIPAETR